MKIKKNIKQKIRLDDLRLMIREEIQKGAPIKVQKKEGLTTKQRGELHSGPFPPSIEAVKKPATTTLTIDVLKDLVKQVIDEALPGNWFHSRSGEFSSQSDATSKTRADIGQYAHPSGTDREKCGRKDRSRTCKIDEGASDQEEPEERMLRALVGASIREAIRGTPILPLLPRKVSTTLLPPPPKSS